MTTALRPPRPCALCGEAFRPPAKRGRPPAYCSDECRRRAAADSNSSYVDECRLLEVCWQCPRSGPRRDAVRAGLCEEHAARADETARRAYLRRKTDPSKETS